jgi:ribosome-associated protein
MMKRPLADPAADSAPQLLPDDDTTMAVRQAVAAALDKKAEDLKVLEVGELTHFTDYFLLCSGQNPRQVQAIADAVEEQLRAKKVRPAHVEGYQTGQWVLLDYGDFVLHVFLNERRRFYGLERLWGDAPDLTAEFVGAAGEAADGRH